MPRTPPHEAELLRIVSSSAGFMSALRDLELAYFEPTHSATDETALQQAPLNAYLQTAQRHTPALG
ncbi:hypothetical protein ACG0Z6_14835 [Roseateles sp. BYS180W]|uniref:Uncharacterized protein n=1 Tax=Roseateles rivi TaxID=3299028 RepID=A0ABW7FYS5_9BURK